MSVSSIADELATNIRAVGGDMLYRTAVVVGSTAIYLAFPKSARQPHDIDLSVPTDIYEQLRTLPDWRICETTYRTKNILRSHQFDIGVGWGGMNHTTLFKKSWQTTDGLHIANISTVYSWKRARTAAKDKKDAEIIRKNLHDHRPISSAILKYEIARVTSCLPAHLRHHPDREWAIHFATHGLLSSFSRNYQPQLFYPQRSIEALAFFDNMEDSLTFLMRRLRKVLGHSAIADFPIDEQFLALTALLYSDLLYAIPQQKSQISISSLAARQALVHGYTLPRAKRIKQIIHEITQGSFVDPLSQAIRDATK